MRAPVMRSSQILLLMTVTCSVLAGGIPAEAQTVRNVYINSWLDYLPPYLEYDPNLSFYMGHEGNGGPGQQSYSRFGGTRHFFSAGGNSVVSMNAEGFVTTDGNGGVTALLNTRQLIGSGLIGSGVSFVAQESTTDQVFEQAAAHVEIFPSNNWSLRGSGYFPTGVRSRQVSTTGPVQQDAIFSGNNLIVPTITTTTDLASMRGVDLEVARTMGQLAAEFFGGYYKYFSKTGASTEGGKLGIRGYISRRLQGHVTLTKDDLFDYQVFGGIIWNLGGGAGLAPSTVRDKLTIPVERNHQVVMTQSTSMQRGEVLVTNGGAPITVTHIQEGAAGTNSGTFENPFNTNMLPGTQGTQLVYLHGGGGPYLNGYTLAPGQRFLGEGLGNDHLIDTDQFGPVALPAGSGGFTRPTIEGTLVAAHNTEISNVSLQPMATGIELNGLFGTVDVNRSTIDGGTTGIDIVGGTGDFVFGDVHIIDPTVTGINIDGGSSVVTFGTPQPPAVVLAEFAPSSITQSGPGAVVTIGGGHSGSFLSNAGTTMMATGGTGLQFDDADGSYDFDADVTLNGGDAGIDILGGSSGTFTFANTDITSPTGPALQIGTSMDGASGGTADVTFGADSSIEQANNVETVLVLGNHSGSLTYNGTISASNGTGLQFGEMTTTADGTYEFNGTTTLNGGDAGIDILGASSGTFTFADTSITNPSGTVFNIDGLGGTSTASVNYSGGSILQTNNTAVFTATDHDSGTVVFDPDIIATDGTGLQFDNADGTYDFNGRIQMTSGDVGIDILNGSDGTFTFSNPTITNTAGGIGVNIDGGTAQATLEGGAITTDGNTGLNVVNTGLTTVLSATDITTTNGVAVNIENTQVDMTLRNLIIDGSPGAGVDLNSLLPGSSFSVTGVTRVLNATTHGIDLTNSEGTFSFLNTDIDGTGLNGINLVNNTGSTTVSVMGGAVDGTGGDGVYVENTNGVTISGLLFGAASALTGDAIDYTSNDGVARTVALTDNRSFFTGSILGRGIVITQAGAGAVDATVRGNSISSLGQSFVTTDGGMAGSLILALDANNWTTFTADFASDVAGSGLDSTIVTSLGENTSSGRGMLFDRVTFDASGAALAGVQATGIGVTEINFASGDGLSFINPTGDLNLTQLNVQNFNGTGLEVYTKGLGTTFNLQVGSNVGFPTGSISTTGGNAIFLDPLTGNINFATVTSSGSVVGGAPTAISSSTGDGIFVDEFTADGGPLFNALRIGELNVSNAARHAVRIEDSSGQFSLGTVDILTTGMDAVSLANNSPAGTRVSIDGGAIKDTPVMMDAINSLNTAITVRNVVLGRDEDDMTDAEQIRGDGIQIVQDDGISRTSVIDGVNSELTDDTVDILGRAIVIETGGVLPGVLTVNVEDNSLQSQDTALLVRADSSLVANTLILNVNRNTLQTVPAVMSPLTIDMLGNNLNPTTSTLRIAGFNANTVTGNSLGGGVRLANATFLTTGNGQVNGGATVIGGDAPVIGSGLELINPTGSLNFTSLDIDNDATMVPGVGLLVDTKGAGTDFFLGTEDGSISSAGGPAMFLDPLTVNMALTSVSSTNSVGGPIPASAGDGVYLEDVAGSLAIGRLEAGTAAGEGLHLVQGAGIGPFNLFLASVAIDGTGSHGILVDATAGSNSSSLTIGGNDMEGNPLSSTIANTTGDGVRINNLSGPSPRFIMNNVTFGGIGGFTGTITNSNINGSGNVDDMFNPGPVDPMSNGSILFNDGVDILQ